MRLTTWNVNGIRNPFSYQPWNGAKTFPAMFDILGSDIVVMQELKIQRKDLKDDMVLLEGWDCYFSLPKHKKGYSGVAIYTRNATCAPIKAEEGLLGILPSPSGPPYRELLPEDSIGGYPTNEQLADVSVDLAGLDAEGRCVVLEFPGFVLLGVYSPANSNGLRDDFRFNFLHALDCRIRNLTKKGKRVVLVGDLNVSRNEADTASAIEDMKKSEITHEDYISTPNRRIFNQMLIGGEVIGQRDPGREEGILWDTTRAFHPERRGMYTHWEQKINARPGNFGSRIDFILVVDSMRSWIRDANIQEGLLGSDHCPVFVDFNDVVTVDDREADLVDILSPAGTFLGGKRITEWMQASTPAFSAKFLPEFDKRRSIKSMFSTPQTRIHSQIDGMHSSVKSAEQHLARASQTASRSTIKTQSYSPTSVQAVNDPTETNSFKRRLSANNDKMVKRQKTDYQPVQTKGQQSLKGFFKTAIGNHSSFCSPEASNDARSLYSSGALQKPTSVKPDGTAHQPAGLQRLVSKTGNSEGVELPTISECKSPRHRSTSPTPSMVESQVAQAEESQRSWGSLFARPVAPLCECHQEPCKSMLTKKKGHNQGRSFWMCARPLGPSGAKERGTQWRCPTFIWCSDWDSKNQQG